MHSFVRVILLVGLLASLVSSAPGRIEKKLEKRTFKIERVRNEAFKGHNGPRQLLKSYRKFGIPVPQGLLDSIAAQAAAAGGSAAGAAEGAAGAAGAGGAGGDVLDTAGGAGAGDLLGGAGAGDLLDGASGLLGGAGAGDLLDGASGLLGGAGGARDLLGGAGAGGAGAGDLLGGAGAGDLLDGLTGLLGGAGDSTGDATSAAAAPATTAAATSKATTAAATSKATASAATSKTTTGAASSSAAAAVPAQSSSSSSAASGNSTAGISGNSTGSAGGSNTGSVTATPEAGDIEYLAPVNIGGQIIPMDFDSGSSDLWVFNTQLPANSTKGHTLYDSTKSTTFQKMEGASFSISYGDGSGAAGNVGTDTVNIGGATVTKQAIELATAVSGSFVEDTQSNGLVGLAYSKLNTVQPQQQQTFFDNVKDSLQEPLFTADLRHNTVGAYEFGTVNTSKFTGEMAWVPVNTTQGFWQFSSTKFAVGNGAPQSSGTDNIQAIADTGTTLILASPAVVDAYYSQVQGAANNETVGGVTIPCNAQMPDLMLAVGDNYMARVNGSYINFAQVEGNTCFGGLQPTSQDLQIYGDIFFKSQFVAFNGGNNSLGVAEHVV